MQHLLDVSQSFSPLNATPAYALLEVNKLSSHLGTNPCARRNGGCQQLCYYLGNGRKSCACAHGYLAEDDMSCRRYDGYLLYSERTILKSIHLTDESNLNQPVVAYENPAYFKNVIALAFDHRQKPLGTNRIFFSDVHFGNIQMINDDWTERRVIMESKTIFNPLLS